MSLTQYQISWSIEKSYLIHPILKLKRVIRRSIKHTLPCDSKCFLQFIQSSFIFPLSFSSLFYLIHFISSFLSYLPKIGAELHHFPVQRIENQLAKMNFLERTNGWMMMPRQIKKPCVGTRPSNAYSPPYHIHMHPHCYMQLYV